MSNILAGKKVAMTGATGFLGYHAARELARHGARLVTLVRRTSDTRHLLAQGIECKAVNLEDVNALTDVLAGCAYVVHTAGAVGFGNDWELFRRVNVFGTRNLLDAGRRAGVRRFLHTSSVVAVGASDRPDVLDESVPWNLRTFRVPYVTTKRWAEDLALAANGPDMDVVVVNPASVLGPDDFSRSEFGTLCARFWKGRIPFHFGGGNNFVDVRDVAAGMRLALERGRAGERYLLAGENRSYAGFFLDLSRAAQRSIPRVRLPNALAGFMGLLNDFLYRKRSKRPYLSASQAVLMGLYFFYDGGKARRELGFKARPLSQTLADTHAFWTNTSRRKSA